ncbi:hypothetical protein C0J52_00353 [Blattella germanica]|nr:hypothetical protein C0J52_00353 [Blattella germanica]
MKTGEKSANAVFDGTGYQHKKATGSISIKKLNISKTEMHVILISSSKLSHIRYLRNFKTFRVGQQQDKEHLFRRKVKITNKHKAILELHEVIKVESKLLFLILALSVS